MGVMYSTGRDEKYHPDTAPRTDRPPTFDPLYGFPNGRKKREMVATKEEMDKWGLTSGQRDYCAHLLIDILKCQKNEAPFASYNCVDLRHVYDKCHIDDHTLRLKEFEREKRLLMRMKRKKTAANTSPVAE